MITSQVTHKTTPCDHQALIDDHDDSVDRLLIIGKCLL